MGTESESEAGALKVYLVDRDVPCPGCGYNLRGLPEPVCPECRQELRINVGLSESRLGLLVTCAGFLFAGTGAAAAVLLTVVAVTVVQNDAPEGSAFVTFVWVPMGGLVSCGTGALSLTRQRGRRWFRTTSGRVRAGVILASIVLPAFWFAIFVFRLLNSR